VSYRIVDGGVLVLEDRLDDLSKPDAIIFDCDGTLIDTASSFQLIGKLIVTIYLDRFCGIECRLGDDFDEAFQLLKMLGGFNNVRRITTILLQAIFTGAEEVKLRKDELKVVGVRQYMDLIVRGESRPTFVRESLKWVISKGVKKLGDYITPNRLEEMIAERAKGLGVFQELKELKKLIGPITPYGSGMLTTLFSELYLGSKGVKMKYGVKPRFYEGPGLIENERLIIESRVLGELKEAAPRGLAILSGKGKWEAMKVLAPILEHFKLEASTFTGDWSREADKPNPAGLIRCCKRLEAHKIVYVGDGGEDLFLIREAQKNEIAASLAAVLTNKYSYAFFTKQKADAILENVNFLPKLFKRP